MRDIIIIGRLLAYTATLEIVFHEICLPGSVNFKAINGPYVVLSKSTYLDQGVPFRVWLVTKQY